jgi:hypothetical protein
MARRIATLTCNDRESLFTTIDRLASSTDLSGFTWTIYAQGCTQPFLDAVKARMEAWAIPLTLVKSPVNQGCSRGFNRLWSLVEDAEIVLNLEDDWYLVDGVPHNWLQVCAQLMSERPEVDILSLRAYGSKEEMWQYGWTRSIPYRCFHGRERFNYASRLGPAREIGGLQFREIPEFLYTNNPCLYRVVAYKRVDIFPLEEFNDSHGAQNRWGDSSLLASNWGYAEALAMEKTVGLTTLYVGEGLFQHAGA